MPLSQNPKILNTFLFILVGIKNGVLGHQISLWSLILRSIVLAQDE
jgi:hypothetical protein